MERELRKKKCEFTDGIRTHNRPYRLVGALTTESTENSSGEQWLMWATFLLFLIIFFKIFIDVNDDLTLTLWYVGL